MSMFTRAGTMVRKHRRRLGSIPNNSARRRSAPTVLQRTGNSRLLTHMEEKVARLSIVSETSTSSLVPSKSSDCPPASPKSVSFKRNSTAGLRRSKERDLPPLKEIERNVSPVFQRERFFPYSQGKRDIPSAVAKERTKLCEKKIVKTLPTVQEREQTTSEIVSQENGRLPQSPLVFDGRIQTLTPSPSLQIDRESLTHTTVLLIKQTPPPEKVFYDSTVVWPDLDEPEQQFSLLSSICEAGLESRNPCDFLHRAFYLFTGTWPVTVFLVILLALPLVMTTIGVNYLHDCPKEPKLPIYLVVGGCFGIIKLLFLIWKQVRRHKDEVSELHDDEDLLTMTRMTNVALNIFLSIWFVFGHIWVIRIWKPHFTMPLHDPKNWCDRNVFYFSFWQLVICHVIISIVFVLGLMFCSCYVCVKCFLEENEKS